MTLERRRLILALGGGPCAAAARPSAARPAPEEDPLDAELARLRRVDPALVRWDEVDRIGVELDAPRAIAAGASGRLWVVGDRSLLLYGARARGASPGWLAKRILLADPPTCVRESPGAGRLYVGLGDRVEVRHADGSSSAAWASLGPDALVTSVVFTNERELLVADAGRRTVVRCDGEGRALGPLVEDERHFVVPSPYLDLARSPAGILWVANPGRHRVESFTAEGGPVDVVGASGADVDRFCGCCNPTHIACLPDGRLVTSEKGLPRVKVLRPGGALDSVVVGGDALPSNAAGLDLEVDATGRILVLVPAERAVRVFAPRSTEGRNG